MSLTPEEITVLLIARRLQTALVRAMGLQRAVFDAWSQRTKSGDEAFANPSTVEGDILRASIVLIHASLDDFLRGVAQRYYHRMLPETLNSIAFVGGNKPKFNVGDLCSHQDKDGRDKTVRELIQECAEGHYRRVSYNDTEDIAELLRSLNIPVERFGPMFTPIAAMMKRRHRIVHYGDTIDDSGPDVAPIKIFDVGGYMDWVGATYRLAMEVLSEVLSSPHFEGQSEI